MEAERELPRVLLVEDEEVVSRTVGRALEAHDYVVCGVVADGREVIAAVQDHRPHAVLMDVRIPGGIDGITLAEEILVCEDTPVVLLSGAVDITVVRRAALSGAYGCLAKPASMASIFATLEIAMHRHAEVRNRRVQAQLLSSAIDAIDTSVIVVRDGAVELMNRAANDLTGAILGEVKVRRPEWALDMERSVERRAGNGAAASDGAAQPHVIAFRGSAEDAVPCLLRRFDMPAGGQVYLVDRTNSGRDPR